MKKNQPNLREKEGISFFIENFAYRDYNKNEI